ncbi:MAG: hypothetical protein KF773_35425 [Deltaproteobacteria bacterium]|nr:hypothetical protein [Deltaproteobacteria bacterium]MCW5808255.1 hypothetical protein [Deltaproteobacteria bacterium]
MKRLACVVAVAGLAAACSRSPRVPTEGEVRDLLLAKEVGLQKIGEELRAQLEKAKVPTKLAECAASSAAPTAVAAVPPDPACTAAQERQKAAISVYEKAATPRLPELAGSAGAYGIAARLVRRDSALSTVILPPCTRMTNQAQFYLEIREYSVSWGNGFRTEDGDEHSNVIIQYKVPYDDAELRIIACFLTDGTERKR